MSIEAETAVLGALLLENEAYHYVSDFLMPEHFSDGIHQEIYRDIGHYVLNSRLANAITLRDKYDAMPNMEDLGGAEYLVDLMREAPEAVTAKPYARAVVDAATARSLRLFAGSIQDIVKGGGDSREMLEEAERGLFSLAESQGASQGFAPLSKGFDESWMQISEAHRLGHNPASIKTTFRDLDEQLGGLGRTDLVIIAGRPSMGKSSLAMNMAYKMARAGTPAAFFSLEMSREQLATRLVAEETGISSGKLRNGQITDEQLEQVAQCLDKINNTPLYIDETGGILISTLASRARRMKRMHGIEAVFVDYIQLVRSITKEGRVQEVSQVTQMLKEVAKELKVPVIALSQLSRAVEQRDDKRPQLSDLRDSGSIEQDADSVMFVYREEYYLERLEPRSEGPKWWDWKAELEDVRGKAEVIVGKNRHGAVGTVKLGFDAALTKFYDL